MAEELKAGLTVHKDGATTFYCNGQSYHIPKATKDDIASDYKTIERHLRTMRVGPVEAILPDLERLAAFPELKRELLDRAYNDLRKGESEQTLGNNDIRNWLNTMEGLIFSMKLTFKRHYPEITEGDILEIIVKVGESEMSKARDEINRAALKDILTHEQYQKAYGNEQQQQQGKS